MVLKDWSKGRKPQAPIAYKGQSDSLIWIHNSKIKALEMANIFGMDSFNVILIDKNGRKCLKTKMSRKEALKFARDYMRRH